MQGGKLFKMQSYPQGYPQVIHRLLGIIGKLSTG